MIVTIYHGTVPNEHQDHGEDSDADMKEHIECDNLKIIRGREFVRLLFFKDGKFKDNREYHDELRAFITENGKTVDRIEFKVNK